MENRGKCPNKRDRGNPRLNGNAFSFFAFAFLASFTFVWQPSAAGAAQSRLVEGQQSSKIFYRLKASYTYTGKKGPEPLEFDVVVGCALELTKYITGDVSGRSSRVPTMVAYEMSDGGAIGIAIPKACRGSTTSNGEVPSDFLPATIQYEDAKDLSLGMLYASEDAYDSPLAKLTFHGASIERATEREFEDFIASDRFENNLISVESSKDFGAPTSELSPELEEKIRQDPRMSWLRRMPRACYGFARLKMPEPLKQYLKRYWNPSGPRFWMVSVKHSSQLRAWLRNHVELAGEQNPFKEEVLFEGEPFEKFDPSPGSWRYGTVTRVGGGSLAARNPKSGYIYKLPPDYYPLELGSAVPWITEQAKDPQYNNMKVLVSPKHKGFMSCFSDGAGIISGGIYEKTTIYEFDKKMKLSVFDEEVNQKFFKLDYRNKSFAVFFEQLDYIYWYVR
jgi:hypothetical protein